MELFKGAVARSYGLERPNAGCLGEVRTCEKAPRQRGATQAPFKEASLPPGRPGEKLLGRVRAAALPYSRFADSATMALGSGRYDTRLFRTVLYCTQSSPGRLVDPVANIGRMRSYERQVLEVVRARI